MATNVLRALTTAGGRPFVVGGTVRDALLNPGSPPKDVDIEVYGLDVDAIVAALAPIGTVDEVGRAFAVLKMRRRGEDFDIAVPRRASLSGAGGGSIADPNATLEQATARRDFTVNALLYDPATDEIVDCWGGLDDLCGGVLRHPSTPAAFSEDPLRVLRAAGFAARFGFRLAEPTAALCRELVDTFDDQARERVWTEWHKLAAKGTCISLALSTLVETGWIQHFPQLDVLRGLEQDPTWHPEGDVLTHSGLSADHAAQLADDAGLAGDDRALAVLAALLHDTGKATHTQRHTEPDGTLRVTNYGHADAGVEAADQLLKTIGAPKHIRDRIRPLVREHMAVVSTPHPSRAAVRRLARRLQPATIAQWAMLVESDNQGRGPGSGPGGTQPWLRLAEQLGTAHGPQVSLLRGEHLIAAGLVPGPAFAPIIAAAIRAQDDGQFTDEPGAVAWLQEHLASA